MIRRGMRLLAVVGAVLLIGTLGAPATGGAATRAPQPDKVAVTDGHVVHDVGAIWHNVTNWGLLGSCPSASTTFSDAPSAMWPGGSGNEYLWAAGLWVGGVVLGERHVTTGGFTSEFRPTADPGDTLFPTAFGAPGGNRYPWPDADDDHDGLEDEEILNGRDDDGDGLIDEDYAAFGDQQFVCTYDDDEPELATQLPDHVPLHVQVVQRSIQWSGPADADYIGYDFTVTNTGTATIEQVYLGLFSDCDIGPRGPQDVAQDDYAGYVDTTAPSADGTMVPVQIAYMHDGAASPLPGYVGWVLCGHDTDPAGLAAPAQVGVHTFQRLEGSVSFALGGDPTNDDERYQLLSADTSDPDVLPGHESDYRVLTSSGPFASLAPGQSLHYQVALVIGSGLEGMVANAAEAVAAYRGAAYDRDGDPANGAEFRVHWLPPANVPVAAWTGRILALAGDDGVDLLVETNLPDGSGLSVERRGAAGSVERRWSREDLQPDGNADSLRRYRLRDTDAGGWPRSYTLVYAGSGRDVAMDQVDLEPPAADALELSAGPNPFNPEVTIRFAVSRAGPARLEILDLRGRHVRTLRDGPHPGGPDRATWNGTDDRGRALPSGVYAVRLTTATRSVRTRVTLLK